jgi:hypothetical protein
MHDDMSAILRSFTEETVSKSRKDTSKRSPYAMPVNDHEMPLSAGFSSTAVNEDRGLVGCISQASDEALVLELARRRAKRFRCSVEAKNVAGDDDRTGVADPTGQLCILKGGNGTIPCRELME